MASKPTHTKTQHRPADRVGASLPPRVSGEALGEVEVAVSECRGAEALSLVLRWWGEGDAPQAGVVFEASRKNPRRGENSCLFPVRVDEHGLGRYLRDARLLRFDVVAHGRVVGALKVGLKSKFYKDPEATGVALPVGTAGTLGAAKRRKKPPLAATYRQPKPTANPWGPGSDDDEEPDAAAATAEVAPPVDEVERFVEGDMTAPPPREAVEDDARWTVEDDAAEREEAVLEGLLRRGEALREQIARGLLQDPDLNPREARAADEAPAPPRRRRRPGASPAPSPPRAAPARADQRCAACCASGACAWTGHGGDLRPGARRAPLVAAERAGAAAAARRQVRVAARRRRPRRALGPYDCAAPFAVDDAFRVGRAVRSSRSGPAPGARALIGLAKPGKSCAALDASGAAWSAPSASSTSPRAPTRASTSGSTAAAVVADFTRRGEDPVPAALLAPPGAAPPPAPPAARGALAAFVDALDDAGLDDDVSALSNYDGAAPDDGAIAYEDPADVAVGAAAVRHVLEVAAVGPCRLPGARGGATVSYAVLGGEPASLWWDGDSPQLNSRSRHDRDGGAGSGTFPLAERPERGVSFVAEVEAVLVFGDGGSLEFRSQPFSFVAEDRRDDAPGDLVDEAARDASDAATAVAESLELPPAGDAALLRAAAAAPPPAPPRSVAAAAPRGGLALLTVVVDAAERLSVPPFRPETPTEDWRWSVSWRSLDGRHAGDTAPAAGALRPDGLFAVAWAAEFAAELPVAALRDGALAFDVLVRAKHAPNAAKLGSVTVDLGLLACGMTRLDGSYQLSDDFRRDRGALRLKIGAAAGARRSQARGSSPRRAAPVVAAAAGPAAGGARSLRRSRTRRLPAPEGPESPGRRREGVRADHLEARARALDAGGVSLADLAGVRPPSLAARPAATGLRASTSSSDAVSTSRGRPDRPPPPATAETERIARIMRGGWAAPG
ncbi:ubiquitin-protein transferase [Aureococcus anophagefferens]|nr:ubiquitin-protein transferase [Aureococcus anophagefferens]